MIYPQKFLNKYPEFRQKLKENENKLVSHYDTYWTLRHLATLSEFGGEITENFEVEIWHEEIWDCRLNKKSMNIAVMFKNKFWRSGMKASMINKVYSRIFTCFKEIDFLPSKVENVARVNFEEIREKTGEKGFMVHEVINDLDALYWFEDAYQDVSKNYLLGQVDFENFEKRIQENLEEEKKAWTSLKAPAKGRYLFGRSLMKYSDDRICEEAGIVHCICKEKTSKHKSMSRVG